MISLLEHRPAENAAFVWNPLSKQLNRDTCRQITAHGGKVARLGQAIREATETPDVQKRMSALGLNFDFRNGDQFRELIVRDHQKYGAIIREAGIQPD